MSHPIARPVVLPVGELSLRPYRDKDLPDLLAAFEDPAIVQWNPGPVSDDRLATARAWMEGRNDWSNGTHASWAIAGADDRLLGSVSLHKLDREQADAEIGYWLAPWARGRGAAARAVSAATDFAFGELALHRVYLYHAIDNTASCRVASSAGFALEGTLRQSYRYPDGAYHDEHVHGRLFSDPALPSRAR